MALDIAQKATKRNDRYKLLLAHMARKKLNHKQITSGKRMADVERVMFKAVIDFEVRSNTEETWTLRDGIAQVNEDFILLRESMLRHRDPHLDLLCDRWGEYFLTETDSRKIAELETESDRRDKTRQLLKPIFEPLWFFFVALCQTLQNGENSLTALDAFWLGLVDEVLGEKLPCFRLVAEFKPAPPQSSRSSSRRK